MGEQQAVSIDQEWAAIAGLKNQLPAIITETDADMTAMLHSFKRYLRAKSMTESEEEIDFAKVAQLFNAIEQVLESW